MWGKEHRSVASSCLIKCLAMEKTHPATADPRAWRVRAWRRKRTYSTRYLDTVWPRSYWTVDSQSFPKTPGNLHGRSVSNVPPRRPAHRGPVRAWEAPDSRSGSQTLPAPESSQQSSRLGSKESRESAWSCSSTQTCSDRDRELLMKDQRRQEVYLKMGQVGSLSLILAQAEATARCKGFVFPDASHDFGSS